MSKNLFPAGVRYLPDQGVDKLVTNVDQTLKVLSPSAVVTDYAPGWAALVVDRALALGYPVIGAAPYPMPRVELLRKVVRSSAVFSASMSEYYDNPSTYLTWIGANVDLLLTYFPPRYSSSDNNLVLGLLSIERHDMFGSTTGGYFAIK